MFKRIRAAKTHILTAQYLYDYTNIQNNTVKATSLHTTDDKEINTKDF